MEIISAARYATGGARPANFAAVWRAPPTAHCMYVACGIALEPSPPVHKFWLTCHFLFKLQACSITRLRWGQ